MRIQNLEGFRPVVAELWVIGWISFIIDYSLRYEFLTIFLDYFFLGNVIYSSYEMCIQNLEGFRPMVAELWVIGWISFIIDYRYELFFLIFFFFFGNVIYSSYKMRIQNLEGFHPVVAELWFIGWISFIIDYRYEFLLLLLFGNVIYSSYKMHIQNFEGLHPVVAELWVMGWTIFLNSFFHFALL